MRVSATFAAALLLGAVLPSTSCLELEAVDWVPATTLGIGGRAFNLSGGEDTYARLPSSAKADLTPGEFESSRAPSGLFVQFQTDASAIYLQYQLNSTVLSPLPYIPPNGYSGCDMFRWDDATSAWRWLETTFDGLSASPGKKGLVVESPLFADSEGWPTGPVPANPTLNATYTYRLHLPNFAPVSGVSVGVPPQATITGDSSWAGAQWVVTFIGTATTQGAVTGRPGQSLPSRLTRSLLQQLTSQSPSSPSADVVVHNMGFGAGSCQLEAGLAKWMASTASTKLYVVDCAWDMSVDAITANTGAFVTSLRATRPGVPLLLVEPTDFRPSWALGQGGGGGSNNNDVLAKRAALRQVYNALLASGVTSVWYQPGEPLTGAYPDWDEPAFDGRYPMDDAHRVIAGVLAPVVAAILNGTAPQPTPVPPLAVTAARGEAAEAVDAERSDAAITWTPAYELNVVNRAFPSSVLPGPYHRLPSAAQGVVRPVIWGEGLDSAGLAAAFTTSSPEIWVNYTSAGGFNSDVHFPATGISGLDLYGWNGECDVSGCYAFIATAANLSLGSKSYTAPMASGLTPNATSLGRYLLYLPTYDYPTQLSIGVPAGYSLAPDAPWPAGTPPVVWYGTSILQGGVAFRPGAVTTSMVSRSLNWPVLNFGFSGNCLMELSVARFLTQITPAPAAFILDCNPNMPNGSAIREAAVPLVDAIRAAWPSVPVFMAEGPRVGRSWAVPAQAALEADKNAALTAAYNNLTSSGATGIAYAPQTQLYSAASWLDSPTNAGVHPTDQGMRDLAAYWTSTLKGVLGR